MNRSYSKIRHIQEANQQLEKRLLSERISTQGTLLTEQVNFLAIYPNVNTLKSVKDTSLVASGQYLKLTKRNPQNGQIIPNTTLTYKIIGKFGGLKFAVNMRNFKRRDDGSLELEAKPDSGIVAFTMRNLVPKPNQTEDGWLRVLIPVEKINAALDKLFNNKGSEAEIDAGSGITIVLRNES